MTSVQAKPQQSAPASPLDELAEMRAGDMEAVNEMILTHMRSDVALIPQLAGYLIAAGGKRIRPLMTLAATALFDGDMTRAHKLAAAVEFIHTATLLHDDVVDDSNTRRGKDSANIVFGNEASVLVGDFLFSRAFQLMVADGSLETLKVLSDASAIIAEGEVLQLSTQNNLDTTLEDYLDVISGKTAALFAAACEVGPIIADQTPQTRTAIRAYGQALGMAFQIVDDVLDYNAAQEKLGKTIGDDFREGKMTAPVLFALQKANAEEKEFWARTIGARDQKDGDLENALTLIQKHDALEKSLNLARKYGQDARAALAAAPDNETKSTLTALIDFTIERGY